MLTYSQRASFAKEGSRRIQAQVDQAVKEVAEAQKAEWRALRAEADRRNAPVPFTSEELKAATHVRTMFGWHRIARVSAKSVSVETGYSWTDRYTLDKILEVRKIG